MYWGSIFSDAVTIQVSCTEVRLKLEGIVLDYLINLLSNHTYNHELWIETERTRLSIQRPISFLHTLTGLSLLDSVRSLNIWEELKVEQLLLCV